MVQGTSLVICFKYPRQTLGIVEESAGTPTKWQSRLKAVVSDWSGHGHTLAQSSSTKFLARVHGVEEISGAHDDRPSHSVCTISRPHFPSSLEIEGKRPTRGRNQNPTCLSPTLPSVGLPIDAKCRCKRVRSRLRYKHISRSPDAPRVGRGGICRDHL